MRTADCGLRNSTQNLKLKTRNSRLRVLVVFAMLLVIAACSPGKTEKQNQQKPPAPVVVATTVRKDVPVQILAIGNVEAYAVVSVRSQVGGQLSKVHFSEGQYVKKGDLLFTIDPRPYEAAVKQAEANLARDSAQMENARQEARRYEELVKKGYVAQSQYDQVRTNADALAAVVLADKAAVESAKLQLSYCFIHSPITGRLGSILVNEGNLIKANDDKFMVVIHQVEPIYVNFSVPERHVNEIKKQYTAQGKVLRVDAATTEQEERAVQGVLTFMDNTVDRATGTIRLKGTFDNRERLLWPGQFVKVNLRLSTLPGAITVPLQAVQIGQQGQYVFVVKPDLTVEMRPVTPGRTFDSEVVVETGLEPGEKVVTDGQLRLVPGSKVEIKQGQKQ